MSVAKKKTTPKKRSLVKKPWIEALFEAILIDELMKHQEKAFKEIPIPPLKTEFSKRTILLTWITIWMVVLLILLQIQSVLSH